MSSYILGLDVGANSIGWAVVPLQNGAPAGVTRAGVRVFAAAVANLEEAQPETANAQRRLARLTRRRLDRLARRLEHLFRLLQRHGLLPPDPAPSPPASRLEAAHRRHDLLRRLDADLLSEWAARGARGEVPLPDPATLPHVLPYLLRARALDEKLSPYALGRALYHLGQRRGFLSNRRAGAKEEEGEVKKGIDSLAAEMAAAGARTLGEYFSRLDPQSARIRGRYTSRRMHEDEFALIWAAQCVHYPDRLTDDLKKQVHHAIFYQRPLRFRKDAIGPCQFELNRRRAPMALLACQRFRLLQSVNHLQVLLPDGRPRPLAESERQALIAALEEQGDLKFAQVRKLLALPRDTAFNLERGGEKKLPGNRTAAALRAVFGAARWAQLTPADRDRLVDDLRSIQQDEALVRRAMRVWGLDAAAAQQLAAVRLEQGYLNLSRQAVAKLLPLLEAGKPYATAVAEVYGPRPAPPPVDQLPLVSAALPHLTNPVVQRALTEVRRVVNALIRQYGKPECIRVELAREVKKNARQRHQIALRNRENERLRRAAAERIVREVGIANPSRADIEKVLLAEECNWHCPYTGKPISMAALFGEHPQFDVEHIIPFARSLDDSFMNKTLCDAEENRRVKRGRTPFEAYGSQPERWAEILRRVRAFKGSAADAKLERFRCESPPDATELCSRLLNDTRYAARAAAEYLGRLYGGQSDAGHRRRIQVATGQVTAFLRREWGLNAILGDGDEKSRDDHRHHAVDALCVALTDAGIVQALAAAAARAPAEGRRCFARLAPPWPSFLADARRAVLEITVSHRVRRKVSGPLHAESFYSRPHRDPQGRECRHIRKPVEALSPDEVAAIVDDKVRECVRAALRAKNLDPDAIRNSRAIAQAFASPADHPCLVARDGRRIPIHRVRIRKVVNAFTLGDRHVVTETNHHVEIFARLNPDGEVARWEGKVVTLLEAVQRLRAGLPIVNRDHGPDTRFLFSLALREAVRMDDGQGGRMLCVVVVVSQTQQGRIDLEFRRHHDARPGMQGERIRKTPNSLRLAHAEKVVVDPLGRVWPAHD